MAIKGTELKNKLPDAGKKNCKECGLPTCFAFAMKIAKGEADIEQCPYLSPEVKAEVKEALTPPMALVHIGVGEHAIQIGQEEVMYRHEKSLLREPAIAVLVSDAADDAAIEARLEEVRNACFERAQVVVHPNLWALRYDSGNRNRFEQVVRKVHEASPLSAVIVSTDLDALFLGRNIYADRNPAIYPITSENVDAARERITQVPTTVGVKANGVAGLIPVTDKLKEKGITQIVMDPCSKNFVEAVRDQTIIRRSALKNGVRALGYPTIAFPCDVAKDTMEEMLYAGTFVAKYAGLVVVSTAATDFLYPLLIQRMDIYSDPRKLRTVEAKVYEFNEPSQNSPVLVTTNFALTFFTVASEAQASKVPVYLAILDTSGFGVQASMASGKFDGHIIADYLSRTGLAGKVKTKRMILPWLARRIKHELRDDLPEWEVLIGPKAINQLSPFLVERAGEWGVTTSG